MKNRHHCPTCNGTKVIKRGIQKGVQIYECKDCIKRFAGSRREKVETYELAHKYIFNKQTYRELSEQGYGSKRSLSKLIKDFILPEKIHNPRGVHVLLDATYFGKRSNDTLWGMLVVRDFHTGENIFWMFIEGRETVEQYLYTYHQLQNLGYTILSVTVDGFRGLQSVFKGTPFQYCQVHMERFCTTKLTHNPKEAPEKELLLIVSSLTKSTKQDFEKRLHNYIKKWKGYGSEKTNPTEKHPKGHYKHLKVRSVLHSLLLNLDILFTFETNRMIPKDTNSLEGHFSHVKDILNIHRGISKEKAKKFLSCVMLAGTIAPKDTEILRKK